MPRPCVFCKGGYDAADAKVLSMGRNFVSESSGVSLLRKIRGWRQSGTRPSQNARRACPERSRRDGAPTLWLCQGIQKPEPPATDGTRMLIVSRCHPEEGALCPTKDPYTLNGTHNTSENVGAEGTYHDFPHCSCFQKLVNVPSVTIFSAFFARAGTMLPILRFCQWGEISFRNLVA